MWLNQFLFFAGILFCIGVYGVLTRKNGVLMLMSIAGRSVASMRPAIL